MEPTDPAFVELIEEEFGEHLRGAARYRNGASEWVHVPSDVDRRDLDLRDVAERFGGVDRPPGEDVSLHVSDESVVLHFPHDDDARTLVSLQPHATVELGLVRACLELLGDERPNLQANDPDGRPNA